LKETGTQKPETRNQKAESRKQKAESKKQKAKSKKQNGLLLICSFWFLVSRGGGGDGAG